MTDDDTDAEPTGSVASDGETSAAPTEDATELLETSAAPTPELAWSTATEEKETEAISEKRSRALWLGPVMALLAAAIAVASALLFYVHRAPATKAPPVAPALPPVAAPKAPTTPPAVSPSPSGPVSTPVPAAPSPSPASAPLPTDSRGLPMLPDNPTPEQQQEVIVGIFDHFGIPYANPQAAAVDAQSVCAYLESGHRHLGDLILWMRETHPDLRDVQPSQFVGASMGTYCRQYGYLMNQPNGSDEATS